MMMLFDLLEVIKDTERPLLITYKDTVKEVSFRDAALDSFLVSLYVSSLNVVTVGQKVYYSIGLREY